METLVTQAVTAMREVVFSDSRPWRQVHIFGAAVGRGCFGLCQISDSLYVVSVYATAGYADCAGVLCSENARAEAGGRGRNV